MVAAVARRAEGVGLVATSTENVQELAHTRRLLVDERYGDAIQTVERFLRCDHGPKERMEALTLRLIGLLRLGHSAELTSALEQAFEASRLVTDLGSHGQLNALAALVAYQMGSLDRCAVHLVRSARALNAIELTDATTAWAWHDLALSYSVTGFHGYALGAIDQARQVAQGVGLRAEDFAAPQIRLRLAVGLDQHGDSDGCRRVLRDIVGDLAQRRAMGTLDDVRPSSRGAYGYALARLAAFSAATAGLPDVPKPRPVPPPAGLTGPDPEVAMPETPPAPWPANLEADAEELLERAGESRRAHDFRALGTVCLAIARMRPVEAVARLEATAIADETLGPAEPYRLRALAHLAAGDAASAYRADRHAFRLASAHNQRLNELFLEAVAARIDSEELRRSVAGYADGQHTDPLTGLPDRDHLEQRVATIIAAREAPLLCLCSLEGFAKVNAVHGRSSGDLVLQRVAGILNRVMRRGDFVARIDDDFAVVLPQVARPETPEISRRIAAAVDREDWEALVPGTRIGVTLGWAGLADQVPIATGADALSTAREAVARQRRRHDR
jgi:diguanylate cyclase (GGDEF)-like protein